MKEEEIYRMLLHSGETVPPRKQEEAPALSPELMQRSVNPLFLGEIPSPDGYAMEQGDCGDSMEVFLSIRDRVVRTARFDTLGCGYTLACGDMAMELAEGRPVTEALGIGPQTIQNELGELPASHRHCAELAARALRRALRDALERARDPWKKGYGRS
jgi:nitrogen fixation protein NifU and related proteins